MFPKDDQQYNCVRNCLLISTKHEMEEPGIELAFLGSTDDQQSSNSRESSVKLKFVEANKSGKEKWNTSAILNAFCSETTTEGFKHLSESHGMKKRLWIVLLVAMLILLTAHISLLVGKFLNFDISTEVAVMSRKKQNFPAVTICNRNMLKARPIESSEDELTGGDQKLDDSLDYIELAKKNPAFGHQKEDLIVKASFHRIKLSLDDFELTLNSIYGNCYTFNKHNTRSTKRSLPGYGLDLILNIESYAYDTSVRDPTEWTGAVIDVHHPSVAPLPMENGVSVAPGTFNKLALTKTELVRLGGHYSDCLEDEDEKPPTYYEGLYVKQHCDNTCVQREILRKCCCYLTFVPHNLSEFNESWALGEDNSWPKPDDKDICYKNNISACVDAEMCWQEIWNRYDRDDLPCSECRPVCRQTIFHVSAVSLKWPSASYTEKQLIPEIESIDPKLHRKIKAYTLVPGNITSETIEDNFLKVQIYFQEMTTKTITEFPAVGNAEFVAELGGALGMWLGWTLLTLFEFLELIVDLVLVKVTRKASQDKMHECTPNSEESS